MKFIAKRGYRLKIFLFIIAVLLLTDAVLHKGMLRVLLPKKFPIANLVQPKPLTGNINFAGKNWIKAVNTTALMDEVPTTAPGIEMDVYFEKSTGVFEVHHDPDAVIHPPLDSLLERYNVRQLKACIWLDFKNLDTSNMYASLKEATRLRDKFNLANKIIIESPLAECLQAFSKEGFYTSYYTAFFNPYLLDDGQIVHYSDSISTLLKQNPVNAVSGYYYQYTFLKNYFPSFPILTWTDKKKISAVDFLFRQKLASDSSVKVVLQPL